MHNEDEADRAIKQATWTIETQPAFLGLEKHTLLICFACLPLCSGMQQQSDCSAHTKQGCKDWTSTE
jgi:hypothetical protein